jgi:NitT/TauT family transport system permease protein
MMRNGAAAVPASVASTHGASWARLRRRPEFLLIPVTFVLIIGTWEALVVLLEVSEFVLPAPSAIGIALYQGFASGLFMYNLWYTLTAILLGYLLSAVVAFLLGTAISQIRILEATIYPYVVALQTMPKIAIAPLIVMWVGFGIESKIVIAALVPFFPMLVNNIVGLKAASPEKIDLMRALCASRTKIFFMVQLPEALPYIFAGLNIGIVLAVLGAIVGEFVGSRAGLGHLIIQMNYNMDIPGVFAVLIILAVLGITLNFIVVALRRRLIFWHKESLALS